MNAYERIQKNILLFSVPIKKELDSGKTITYKLKFIDSFRFMSSKLSDLINNLSEIYCKECRGCKERKNAILQNLKIINCTTNTTNVKKGY